MQVVWVCFPTHSRDSQTWHRSPPGANAANYISLAQTLSNFASQAADEISSGDETAGYARYAVLREHTQELLTMINHSLGTRYAFTTLSSC